MRRDDEMLLNSAVQAVHADEPDAEQIAASAKRVLTGREISPVPVRC
jgi:hypothetical protein